jgi:hypothetical protein|tara:strand:- start:2356 stop:2511 length:156 start_codon:yes stop_codon:yes gene_type:complete
MGSAEASSMNLSPGTGSGNQTALIHIPSETLPAPAALYPLNNPVAPVSNSG